MTISLSRCHQQGATIWGVTVHDSLSCTVRSLALLIAWFSFGQCGVALALAGPHSDVPGQPWTSYAVMLVALAGLLLARAVWRRRPQAGRWLVWWGIWTATWVVAVVWIISSSTERRDALLPLAVGLPVWGLAMRAAARYVRRQVIVTDAEAAP